MEEVHYRICEIGLCGFAPEHLLSVEINWKYGMDE